MAVQYLNMNVTNPNTGERGMWYYTGMTTEQAVDAAARDAGTYRAVKGDVPVMTGEQQDMTTEEFYKTYNDDYPSVAVTPEGLAEPAPVAWPEEKLLPDMPERLEYLEELYLQSGVAVGESVTAGAPSGILADFVSAFNDISSWFHEIYLEVYFWVRPFDLLASPLLSLSRVFSRLAWNFSDFGYWVNVISARIQEVLSWDTIWSYILSYVPNLVAIRDWFTDVFGNVTAIITDWWASTILTVQGWISAAIGAVQESLGTLESWVAEIQEFIDELELDFPDVSAIRDWFTDWAGNVTGVIDSWWEGAIGDVQDLINSALREIRDLLETWQEVKDQVVEFISDPLEWLWERFTDWFLGPEE